MRSELDEFELDTLEPGRYLKGQQVKMRWASAITGHVIALGLVAFLCLALLLNVIFLCKYPEQQNSISGAFDRWYSVVSPFAGLAVGAYYGASKTRDR